MYNDYEVLPVPLTNMASRQYFHLAVAAAFSAGTLTVNAQNMRATGLETNTPVTSLTNLKTPRHPAAPFGAIDASAGTGVVLDVTVAPDPTSTEVSNQFRSERGPGRSSSAGSILHRSVGSPGFASAGLQGATGSVGSGEAPRFGHRLSGHRHLPRRNPRVSQRRRISSCGPL